MNTTQLLRIASVSFGATGGPYSWKRDLSAALPRSVISPRGPLRPVVTVMLLQQDLGLTTDGATSLTTADVYTCLKSLYLTDVSGVRYDLSGFDLRFWQYQEFGASLMPEPAAVPISQTNTLRTVYHVIPFALPRGERKVGYVHVR